MAEARTYEFSNDATERRGIGLHLATRLSCRTCAGNVRLHNAASREAVGSEANGLQAVWEEVGGMARMKWLLWTGENIDTATAKEWAWSRRSCPMNAVQARALEIATKLTVKPPV